MLSACGAALLLRGSRLASGDVLQWSQADTGSANTYTWYVSLSFPMISRRGVACVEKSMSYVSLSLDIIKSRKVTERGRDMPKTEHRRFKTHPNGSDAENSLQECV